MIEDLQIEEGAESPEMLFIAFARIVLARMRQWYQAGEPEELTHLTHYFDETGFIDTEFENVKSFVWLLRHRYLDSFLTMEEANQCARKHWDAGIFRYPYTIRSDTAIRLAPETYSFEQVKGRIILDFLYVVENIWKTHGTFRPTDNQILARYRYFKELWLASTIRIEVVCPLLRLESDLRQKYQISQHLWISPFTPEEKTEVWNKGRFLDSVISNPLDLERFAETKFSITGLRFQNKGSETRETQEIVYELRNIITALRLFKAGALGAPALFEKGGVSSWMHQETYNRSMQYEDRLHDYEVSLLSLPSSYYLRETEMPRVKTLFEGLQGLSTCPSQHELHKPHGDLTIALRRFNQVYGRVVPEDRIIDLTISLENSLLAGVEKHAKKYCLALRGAALLLGTKNPGEVKAFLEEMYKNRNIIVHGGKTLSELGKHPKEYPWQCEEMTRDILREYVIRLAREKGQALQGVNTELDKKIGMASGLELLHKTN